MEGKKKKEKKKHPVFLIPKTNGQTVFMRRCQTRGQKIRIWVFVVPLQLKEREREREREICQKRNSKIFNIK